MADTVYSYGLRTVECDNCGAPVTGALEGGTVTCTYCEAAMSIEARAQEHRQETKIDEPSRVAGLWAQEQVFDWDGAMRRPPEGMEQFNRMLEDPRTRRAALEAFRQEWEKTRHKLGSSADLETETHLFRLAFALQRIYVESGEAERARASLETALGLLSDVDQRNMIRCALSQAASDLGDGEAAQAWLEEVNPRPIKLESDTAYRLARGKVLLAREDYEELLDLVGREYKQVPLIFGQIAFVLRAHALAGLGDVAKARAEIRSATAKFNKDNVLRGWKELEGPSSPYASVAAGRASLRINLTLVFFVVVLPLLTVGVDCFTPACLSMTSCGGDGLYSALLRKLNACPASRAALGDDITWAVGCNNCSGEGSGGCRDGCGIWWRTVVTGSKASGVANYRGGWVYGKLELYGNVTVEGKEIDLNGECRDY